MPVGKFDYDLETRAEASVKSFSLSDDNFFPLFSSYIYGLCNDLPSITTTTNSVLDSFASDGVIYLELRTTPRAIPSANITTTDYIRTILSCITTSNTHTPMKTSLILSIDRRSTLATAHEVVTLALAHRTAGVIGIDLCGDPSVGDISIFGPAFARAADANLPITLHFAEAPWSSRPEELWKLLEYNPRRIGHVIHVPGDVKREIERRGIGLELCLSCNVHAKMITGSYGDHHFGEWWGRGCPVALSTDDVGVFGSPLSNEYRLVAEHFGLSDQEIFRLARSAVDCIFGGEEEKERLRGLMWG
ncbi:Metallo-dependent hydrolase [Glarea lozoyensis ATCC 20868]|uniref:Metallo-dependent hydrolase n=1 Tax=Glarea lozoyensis (strain ATCC 20868 / MF5171) TaxID=1116229 RepID=S3CU37_GLAL2|nr:Metallo-dependent hydrolase [Glarea lozoyensis ATCC 20868]EPE29922.1 Metallo-dependent hydrolase [Glarea lozoyensis ATCC 20868]